MKAAILAGLAITGIATAANAAVIYSNTFEDAPGDTQTQAQVLADTTMVNTGTVGAAHTVINPPTFGDNLTNVFKLSTNSTAGTSGSGTGVFTWSLGNSYDLYAGGNGTLAMDVARGSTTPDLKIELLSAGAPQTAYTYTFTDYYNNTGGWHTLSIPLTSVDTSIDSVRFTIRRTSGTGGVAAYVDNVNAQSVPESGSAVLLGLSVLGLAAMRRRKATA